MYALRVEHPVPDFDGWKKAFDGDPVGRRQSGVRRHRVLRPLDDPRYVMIDLEFETGREAEAMLEALRRLWGKVEGKVIRDPRTRVAEEVEIREY
jgi:hypothetical protein